MWKKYFFIVLVTLSILALILAENRISDDNKTNQVKDGKICKYTNILDREVSSKSLSRAIVNLLDFILFFFVYCTEIDQIWLVIVNSKIHDRVQTRVEKLLTVRASSVRANFPFK